MKIPFSDTLDYAKTLNLEHLYAARGGPAYRPTGRLVEGATFLVCPGGGKLLEDRPCIHSRGANMVFTRAPTRLGPPLYAVMQYLKLCIDLAHSY